MRHPALPRCAAICAALACAWPLLAVQAQVVESSDVVGAGHFQFETGFAIERNKEGGVRDRVYATPTLLSYGIGEVLELRVETDGMLRARSDGGSTSTSERGYGDASLGLKWHVADGEEASATPAMALLVHADIDSGSAAFRGDGVRPSVRGVAEWDLGNERSTGVMLGAIADRDADGRRFIGGIAAIMVSTGLADQVSGYVELAGHQLASKAHGGNVVTFGGGLIYAVNDSLELDLSFALGLNHNTPDLQWGIGLSFRL